MIEKRKCGGGDMKKEQQDGSPNFKARDTVTVYYVYAPMTLFLPLFAVTPIHLYRVTQSHSPEGLGENLTVTLEAPFVQKYFLKRIADINLRCTISLRAHSLFITLFVPIFCLLPILPRRGPRLHHDRERTSEVQQPKATHSSSSRIPSSVAGTAADGHPFVVVVGVHLYILFLHSERFRSSEVPLGQSCQSAPATPKTTRTTRLPRTPRTPRTPTTAGTPRSRASNVHFDTVYILYFILVTNIVFSVF
jgi:hypothetical protein